MQGGKWIVLITVIAANAQAIAQGSYRGIAVARRASVLPI